MKKIFFFLSLFPFAAMAQDEKPDKWYFGLSGGIHSSSLDYSDLDSEVFPEDENLNSGNFSLFVQYEFGKQNRFAVRPQISYLSRGGKLTGINSMTYDETVDDIFYKLSTDYIDFRMPVILNFLSAKSKVRPYLFVAPVAGFAVGGEIKMQQDNADNSYQGYEIEVSDANMASAYFAGQVGVGVKFAIPTMGHRCFLGIEAAYEFGLSDTYGDKEKDGEAGDVAQLFTTNYKLNGDRKFNGFEINATLSVPFSIFKSKKKPIVKAENTYVAPTPVPVVAAVPVEQPRVEEKPCYTLDEIITLMLGNESVDGKTICAVDDISFDFSKSTIKPESYEYLDKLASTLSRMNKRIEVKGHTDNVGSDEFNMNLSKERAKAVVEYLVKKGVSREKLTYSYYGKTKPLTGNDTEEGRAMNRRVEITILN